jgi:signal transduction histidine kinase
MNKTPTTVSPMVPALESVLCTEELNRRPSRPPDYERENRALVSLAQALADSPRTILQTLADTILKVFQCDSAGVSLVTEDGTRFHWPAIAGVWTPHIGGGTPRDFGPCGDVLDRNCPLLFRHFERRYTYFLPVTPPVEECLLVPFYVAGIAVGTIWAITHDDRPGARKFDNEDLRMLVSLGTFASAAYQAVEQLRALSKQDHERQEAAQALRDMNEALLVSSVKQHELAERLRENDRRKDEFLAMLAHELRNPLAAIGNAVGVASKTGLKEHIDWSMEVITRQMTHLIRLIDDLLDVSRINRGKIELRRDVLDATPILDSAAATVRTLVEERKHSLDLAVDRGNLWVKVDPTRLEQVVVNLLNNAAKYSENAGHILLSARHEANEVVISVKDKGVGISPEKLPEMFELFAQGDRSLARSEGGLGIGLTVVKKLVEMHGGTITATSEGPGKGSEFVIRLPAAKRPAKVLPTTEGPTEKACKQARILVVDDNADTAQGMARLLTRLGHEVATAHSGPKAIEVARAHRPEFVFLDIGLPGMSGYEVASKLRQEECCAKAVIVAISGYGQNEDRRQSKEAGFDHHLIKPLNYDALLALLVARP